jgi:chromosomal replication initiator protein
MDAADAILLPRVLAHLRTNHPLLCRLWFEELVPLGIAGGALELRASSPIHRDYLKRACADAFNDAVRTVTGHLISVRFLGPEDASAVVVTTPRRAQVIAPASAGSGTATTGAPSGTTTGTTTGATASDGATSRSGHSPVSPAAPGASGGSNATLVPAHAPATGHAPGTSGPAAANADRPRAAVRPLSEEDVARASSEAALLAGHFAPTREQDTKAPSGTNAHANGGAHASAGAMPGQTVPGQTAPGHDAPEVVVRSNAAMPPGAVAHPRAANGEGPRANSPHTGPSLVQVGDPSRSGYESLTINPDYSFEHFVPGPENRLAHAAAIAVAANPGRAYNPFFVHGGIGLGKSHLLQATCLRIAETNPSLRMYYISCEGFFTQFIESVQNGQMAQFRHRYRDVDLLVIDDIHFLATRDRTQEEFFHTFNSLYHAQKQIILSSDAAPEEIPHLEERLVSRFMWGLVTKIDPPSYETRLAILKTKARLRGLTLPDDAAGYLAQRIDRNVRELEGAIIKLQIQSSVEQTPISLEMAKASMGEPQRVATVEPSMQAIIGVVTDFYRIRLADLQSKQRQRSITLPRQVCMYLARRLTRHSLEEIGGFFGGRDHTTVMHAIRIVEERRAVETEFDETVRSLEERSRGGPPA